MKSTFCVEYLACVTVLLHWLSMSGILLFCAPFTEGLMKVLRPRPVKSLVSESLLCPCLLCHNYKGEKTGCLENSFLSPYFLSPSFLSPSFLSPSFLSVSHPGYRLLAVCSNHKDRFSGRSSGKGRRVRDNLSVVVGLS